MLRNSGRKTPICLKRGWFHTLSTLIYSQHLGKVIRGNFDLVLGILKFSFKYGPDHIEKKQLRDRILGFIPRYLALTQQAYLTHIGSKKSDSNGPTNSSHESRNSFTANVSTTVNSSSKEKRWMITPTKRSLTPKSQINTAVGKIHYLHVIAHNLAHPYPPCYRPR